MLLTDTSSNQADTSPTHDQTSMSVRTTQSIHSESEMLTQVQMNP